MNDGDQEIGKRRFLQLLKYKYSHINIEYLEYIQDRSMSTHLTIEYIQSVPYHTGLSPRDQDLSLKYA